MTASKPSMPHDSKSVPTQLSGAAGSSEQRAHSAILGAAFGRYEGLMRLAAGGMGQVLVARVQSERGVRRLVALKTILSHLTENELFLKMFIREAEIASRLHHPNVVPVLELGRTEYEHFLVMEYFPSVPLNTVLKEALKREKPMPSDVAAAIVADAAGGLHAAHELTDDDGTLLHLVHRDATPSNLLVGGDGSVKVTDFGVAKATGAQFENMTVNGDLRGKIGYLAPEQVTGESLDRRSDIFTLGIVLWECVAGRRLFGRKDSEVAAIRALMDERIPDVRDAAPDVPEALARIVARALDRDRERRYQTAAELRQALTTQLLADTDARRLAFAKETIGEILSDRQRAIANAVAELDSPSSVAKRRLSSSGTPGESSGHEPLSVPSLNTSAASSSKTVPPPQPTSRLTLVAGSLALLLVGGGGAMAASGMLKNRTPNQATNGAPPARNAPRVEPAPLPPPALAPTTAAALPPSTPTTPSTAAASSDAGAPTVASAEPTTVAPSGAGATRPGRGVRPRSGRPNSTTQPTVNTPTNSGTSTSATPPERIEM